MTRTALFAALFALTLTACGEKPAEDANPVETPAAEVAPSQEMPAEVAPADTPAPETPAAEAAQE